jgi:predicted nucleic-acid-binding protein
LIGVDTNVLLRFLIADDLAQHENAKQLLYKAPTEEKIRISNLVLMEIVWGLRRVYSKAEATILEVLETLMAVPSIELEGIETLMLVTEGKLSLSLLFDGLIEESNRKAGCNSTFTFDQNASSRIPGMVLLQ